MDSQFQQEQEQLNNVKKVIQHEVDKLDSKTRQRKEEVIHSRKHFWDEIKINVDSFDDYLETVLAIRQEAQALAVSETTHRHSFQRLSTLQQMLDVPYFGRIDFLEEGDSQSEEIYIGISTLRDETGENILIYDWRAPISSVYYDYQPGPAQYKTPGGVIKGELEKKWQYLIRNGELQSMFDTSLTIGDEILQEVLGQGTDKYMNSIVATIQKEQNRIIRHDRGRMLIVHGAAGSGKTSAALQRIAYLLYKYRENLNADQIILFSPNTLFSNYVSNVLPELGEENMQQVTFQEYLYHRLSNDFAVEDPYDQLEYVLTETGRPEYDARVSSIRFKASAQFLDVIQAYVKSLEKSGMVFKDIKFRGEPIVTAQEMEEFFYHEDLSLGLQYRLEKLKDWLLDKVRALEKLEWKKEWVEETIELLSDEEYYKAQKYLAKKAGYTRENSDDYDMDTKALARLIVRQRLRSVRKRIRSLRFVDISAIYKQLFENHGKIQELVDGESPKDWPAICEVTLQELEQGRILYEDATPFLQLQDSIFGFQANRSIRHVVVDEAQDYSAFQFEFLKRLFPAARMTVLGDFNQAIFAHANEKDDFQELTQLYGPDKTEVINLTRSYRSTKPIIEFTRRLIPEGDQIIPFNRDGERPALTTFENHDELHAEITSKVSELKDQGNESIAIICKSAAETEKAYEALSDIEELKMLKSSSIEYEQGVVVLPSYLSKGIEFDAVIIYDASEKVYGDESLRRVFYTACTRAMHGLQLYSVGEPTNFIEQAMEEGFLKNKPVTRKHG
ncbi:RNA polymerase recycling motor HelD [Oceanobacillus luteolus]|uniref:DNA 3'-5' helicase n=1 Tax=Oceanobacillus luteolus TaxID=1274358 RepID=A0ABW4HMN6_9BACI